MFGSFSIKLPIWLLPQSLAVALSLFLVTLNVALPLLGWSVANLLSLCVVVAGIRIIAKSYPGTAEFRCPELIFLLSCSVVASWYSLAWYTNHVPHDFWLDFPQQTLFANRGLSLAHPFFPDLELGGQYGRNLLVAGIVRLTTLSPMTATFALTATLQCMLVWLLFDSFRELEEGAGFKAVLLLFLGLGVGGWCGLLDHFFHHAALANFLLFAAWHHLRGRSFLAFWPTLALGIVFPLYICLLLAAWLPTTRPTKRSIGVVLLLLVLLPLQGGPLRQLATASPDSAESISLDSQQQRFTTRFPKHDIFQLKLQPWLYWRVSLGLSSLPFLEYPEYQKSRYVSVFSWEVLRLHWLPLWLAPLTLLVGTPESRRWSLFGLVAYFTPSVVDFGPVYEGEYYRWELAAALGFASALALIPRSDKRLSVATTWVLLAICCWPGVYRLCSNSWSVHSLSQQAWFRHHQQSLRLRDGELQILTELKARANKDDIFWRDSLPDFDDNKAMNGDSSSVGLAGIRMTGKAFPVMGDFIGRPPFRPSLNAKAFWVLTDPAAVAGENVRWLITNKAKDFSEVATLIVSVEDTSLWEVRPLKTSRTKRIVQSAAPTQIEVYTGDCLLDESWCPEFETSFQMHWVSRESPWESLPIYQSRKDGLLISAPVLAGDYNLKLSTGQTLPATVKPTAGLEDLRIRGSWKEGDNIQVKLQNQSPNRLRLYDVQFLLLPMSKEGRYEEPVAAQIYEIFTIKGGAAVTLIFPPTKTPIPERASLYVLERNASRLLPLR